MQYDRAKLRTVVLYAISKCEPSKLGAVKLHKLLYFSDMIFYAAAGHPITGATYRKRPLGPTCDQLLETLRDLAKEGAIEIRESDYFGYLKKEYIPRTAPDVERLSKGELFLLDEVIQFVCENNTAKTISDFSHNRAWEIAEFGEVLPYNSVFHLFPNQVSLEAMEWAGSEASKVEAERSSKNALEGISFSDFRSRVLEARGTK